MRSRTADLSLRPRHPADDELLYRLSDRLFAPYSRHPARALATMLAERGSHVRVAESGAALVGFFVLAIESLGRPFGPWEAPAVARLNAIAVRPEAQGTGVGRFLLSRAEELARERGAVSLHLMTAESNRPARALFDAAGYQRLFLQDEAYTRGQRGVVMTRLL